MAYEGDRHRGPWAGNQFEITTTDRMKADMQWQDISDRVVGVLDEVWKAEMGDNWKEEHKDGTLVNYPFHTV